MLYNDLTPPIGTLCCIVPDLLSMRCHEMPPWSLLTTVAKFDFNIRCLWFLDVVQLKLTHTSYKFRSAQMHDVGFPAALLFTFNVGL